MGAWVSVELLLGNSAFVRLASPALQERRVQEIADALEHRRIGVCLPFLIEAGYAARGATDHDELLSELLALPTCQQPETSGPYQGIRWSCWANHGGDPRVLRRH